MILHGLESRPSAVVQALYSRSGQIAHQARCQQVTNNRTPLRPVIHALAQTMIISRHMKRMRIEENFRDASSEQPTSTRKHVMPKAKKTIKVRDQKPIKDPKGGMGHRHAVNTAGGDKGTNRHHLRFAPN
jgi:hypothetical protein